MNDYLTGKQIRPQAIVGDMSVVKMVDSTFQAYNAARLREACHLLTQKILNEEVTVALGISGALTPAGLGISCIVPLLENGFIDWIVSTGANLYHDTHFGIGLKMHQGRPSISDVELREEGIVRIFDIFFEYEVLLSTDRFYRKMIRSEEFQREMSSAEFHYLTGKYLAERERVLGIEGQSVLAAAHRFSVPIYTSSPGDSSIGMNVAASALRRGKLKIDTSRDVNETAALVLDSKRRGGKSAVVVLGGGSPKNFILQTEPHIQEVLGIDEKGHDYFLQITDARTDTGGLSGATPSEAVSWGKVDPSMLPDAVVCYLDSTIALPLMTSYALARVRRRIHKRLYDRLDELVVGLRDEVSSQEKS